MTPGKPSTQSADSPKTAAPLLRRSFTLFAALEIPNHSKRMMEQTTYRLAKLPRQPGIIPPSWRMTKLTEAGGDSDSYTIHRDREGTHCTCQDFVARKEKVGEPCKHIAFLVASGLLGEDFA